MPLLVFAAAAATAISLPLMLYSLVGLRSVPRGAGRNRNDGLADLHQLSLERGALDRLLRPIGLGLTSRLRRIAPSGWAASLERKIRLSGVSGRWSLDRIVLAKVGLAAIGAAGAWVGLSSASSSSIRILATLAAGAFGFIAPDILLGGRARDRQTKIQHELPDALDQMTMSVEAGLGFEAAMGRVAQAGGGPLSQELTYALQEMQIGVSRQDALRNLAERTDVPDLRNFIFTVIQSEAYGLPIAKVLRVQAGEARLRRQQRAEEQAMKIPVKIIFPLLLCIFPSLFIVLLGPAAIRIYRILS